MLQRKIPSGTIVFLRLLDSSGVHRANPIPYLTEPEDENSRKVARRYTNVMLTGPTGAGKELVARAIHQISPVSQQKPAICNCSTLVDTLLESQLFGHVRGAFTGATDTRPGFFEYANGGTVFLDEIGGTSLPMQAKLLRVIQNREIQRVRLAGGEAHQCSADRRDQPRPARRSAGGPFPGGSVLPPEFDPDSDPFTGRKAGRYSTADLVFSEKIQ